MYFGVFFNLVNLVRDIVELDLISIRVWLTALFLNFSNLKPLVESKSFRNLKKTILAKFYFV